jgi:hypothetical protein
LEVTPDKYLDVEVSLVEYDKKISPRITATEYYTTAEGNFAYVMKKDVLTFRKVK